MHAEGSKVRQLYKEDGKLVVTSKNEKEDYTYLAVFNTSDSTNLNIDVELKDLGYNEDVTITNLWTGEMVGNFKNIFSQNLASHASGLYKIEDAN